MAKTKNGPARVKTYAAAKKNNDNPNTLRFLYRNNKSDTGIRTITNPAPKASRNGWLIVGNDMDNGGAVKSFRMDKMTVL